MVMAGLVSSVRVNTLESVDEFKMDATLSANKCNKIQRTFTKMRNKLEKSVKKGNDLTSVNNVVRMLRASRNLKSAIRKECDWVNTENGTDAPFLGELVQTKLAEMPCAKSAEAFIGQGMYLQAVDVYVADVDECKPHMRKIKPNVSEVVSDSTELEVKLVDATVDGHISLIEQYAVSGAWKPWVVVLVVVLFIFFTPIMVTIALWALLITALICAFSKESFNGCWNRHWDNWGY